MNKLYFSIHFPVSYENSTNKAKTINSMCVVSTFRVCYTIFKTKHTVPIPLAAKYKYKLSIFYIHDFLICIY